ncbi:hypothetical protein F441_15456 [Phytophthora nicotianae CJ01A1]|uniref:Phosphatidate cytidylyltransferase n=6 Tax=Phytophthora nicotianae TaxID=4792 RepID=W2R1W3_PHYN3|nr:hypothetical protein PPTG_04668 [Phytophthora nicotianae INRA-310]ETI38665.1 hypothetical protein F443_15636 [Phytophthora nicotianae P1569]ETK78914.1 hypothetical protein L915_15180 [Phytophthora nicotianae]ETO67429.1 hypothetical protein F444_15619 [Phytophthora nicotianae P1976]ETP08573.1 hypothetical protein F441_15456 [Phytophthora nicotianae CJ01A1]ETP36613.1 hypothetical protein F442_15476 [Phytophthora nicotianae P10297]KUG01435.1 hypothetical protein AM587_10015578 [Phytophthora n
MELQERPPPCHAVCTSHTLATLFSVTTYVILPAVVVTLVEVGDAYLLLFLGQLLLAVGAVEWSWLAFRIRQRLLLAVNLHEDASTTTESIAFVVTQDTGEQTQQTEDEEARRLRALEDQPLRRQDPRENYTRMLSEAMRARSFAIAPLADRICSGRWYLAAFFLATLGAVISVLLAYAVESTVFDSNNPASGWRMMVGASVEAAFVSIFCSSLAPSGADAVVLVVYQACVLVASMNAYLKLQVDVIASDAQVDPLFIILAGAIIIIVFRVVTSKVVMQSLLLVLCDVLGLVCIVSPLIAFADLIDQTMNQSFRNQLALFVLVVLAADVGDCLAKELQLHWPRVFKWCRHPVLKSEATTKDVEALAISLMCGAIIIAAVRLGSGGSDFNAVEVVVLFCAIALGQWCRLWMAHVRQMAKVSTSAFYFPEGSRTCGVLDRMAVFLVAIIVYYPYIKQKYFA